MIWKMHSPERTVFSDDWPARSLTIGFGLSLAIIQFTTGAAFANPTHEPNISSQSNNPENQLFSDAAVDQNVPALADTFTFRPPTELANSTTNALPVNSTHPVTTALVNSTAFFSDQTAAPSTSPVSSPSVGLSLPSSVLPNAAIGSVSDAADPTALFTFRPRSVASPPFNAIGSSPAANVNPVVAQASYQPNGIAPLPSHANSIPSVATPGYPPPPPGYLVPTPAYPAPVSANSPPATSYPSPGYPVPGYAIPGYPVPGYPTNAYPTTAYPVPGYPTTAYPTTAYPTTPSYPVPGYPVPGYPVPGYPTNAYPTTAYPTTPGYPVPGYPGISGYAVPAPVAPAPTPQPTAQRSLPTSTALTPPSIRFQGVYELQGGSSSARARVSGLYPLSPNVQFGGTFDLTDGNAFSDSQTEGASINELYLAASLPNIPNLRFVIGQLDLTSYLDRNSFAKDGASQFFNSLFQTNSALTAASIGSRPGVLLNWSVTDNLEARAVAFSSARSIGNFALDGFAGEVGLRVGNAIIRGTYVSARDGGTHSGFQEIFGISRNDGRSGIQSDDREDSYGVNAELFIPQFNLGLFGRYGHYENQALGQGGDTYSGGLSFLDLLMSGDRLGVAYGRNLSNNRLRQDRGNRTPDVLEVYYDFRLLPNLRLGFTFQELNEFSEAIAGFRLRTDFDLLSRRAQSQ